MLPDPLNVHAVILLDEKKQPFIVVLVDATQCNQIGYNTIVHDIHQTAKQAESRFTVADALAAKGYQTYQFHVAELEQEPKYTMSPTERSTDKPRWMTEMWTLRLLNPTKDSGIMEIPLETLRTLLLPYFEQEDQRVVEWLKHVYKKQTPTILQDPNDATLQAVIGPPDCYADEQIFACQHCGQHYVYGKAKQDMKGMYYLTAPFPAYNPLCFCCAEHCEAYYTKHGHGPSVGAEIPLRPKGEEAPTCSLSHVLLEPPTGFALRVEKYGLLPSAITKDKVVLEIPVAMIEDMLRNHAAPAPISVAKRV